MRQATGSRSARRSRGRSDRFPAAGRRRSGTGWPRRGCGTGRRARGGGAEESAGWSRDAGRSVPGKRRPTGSVPPRRRAPAAGPDRDTSYIAPSVLWIREACSHVGGAHYSSQTSSRQNGRSYRPVGRLDDRKGCAPDRLPHRHARRSSCRRSMDGRHSPSPSPPRPLISSHDHVTFAAPEIADREFPPLPRQHLAACRPHRRLEVARFA